MFLRYFIFYFLGIVAAMAVSESRFTQINPGFLPKNIAIKLLTESKNLKFMKENKKNSTLLFKNSRNKLCSIQAKITPKGYFIPLSVDVDLDSGKTEGKLFVAVNCK